mmetsp:Transcript_12950/g.43539  ORF Transcript_12950/g.43539 Transcript_12950/m.43539 type:complete len:625 (-) Transcript_12950:223-2097(-)
MKSASSLAPLFLSSPARRPTSGVVADPARLWEGGAVIAAICMCAIARYSVQHGAEFDNAANARLLLLPFVIFAHLSKTTCSRTLRVASLWTAATVGPYLEVYCTWLEHERLVAGSTSVEAYAAVWFEAFGFYLVMTMTLPFLSSVILMPRLAFYGMILGSIGPPGLLFALLPPWPSNSALLSLWLLDLAVSVAVFHSLDRTSRDVEAQGRAQERYIAALSHDFGTPISALQMATQQIEEAMRAEAKPEATSPVPARVLPLLAGMQAALEVMSALKRKAVDMGKLRHGERLTPERGPVSLREIVQRKLPDLVRYMPHREEEVRVEYSVGDEVAEAVLTDGSWVFMIFINFASNAFKSTRQGLVSFSAHLVQGRLRLLVSDTGIGLSSAAAKALWQPFRQASRWQSGTGLGLYHVQQLAVALGGSVGYQANLQAGSGAVFWVDLPYEPTTLPASHAASPSALQREARVPVAGAVLIAEDNVFILQLTKELLHAAGVSEVLLAANGVEAFSLIASPDAPDIALVLMDVLMPFMDGIECTRRIRQWEASRVSAPPVRIIALSANGSDAACQRDCLSAGMNGVLCKPVSLPKLVATLKQGQGRRGGADPAPQRCDTSQTLPRHFLEARA